jgi:hypothetical protein
LCSPPQSLEDWESDIRDIILIKSNQNQNIASLIRHGKEGKNVYSRAYLGRDEDHIVDVSLWNGRDAKDDQSVSSWQLRMENHAIMKNLQINDKQNYQRNFE